MLNTAPIENINWGLTDEENLSHQPIAENEEKLDAKSSCVKWKEIKMSSEQQ